jgi:hypothetical protein
MSTVLQAWEFPVPTSYGEAQFIVQRLHRLPPRPSPRLTAFVDRLLDAHPDRASALAAGIDPAWADPPCRGAIHGPMVAFSVRTAHLQAVRPFVIATANVMGLVLRDGHTGRVYLPDGTALTPDGRVVRVNNKRVKSALATASRAALLRQGAEDIAEGDRHGDDVGDALIVGRVVDEAAGTGPEVRPGAPAAAPGAPLVLGFETVATTAATSAAVAVARLLETPPHAPLPPMPARHAEDLPAAEAAPGRPYFLHLMLVPQVDEEDAARHVEWARREPDAGAYRRFVDAHPDWDGHAPGALRAGEIDFERFHRAARRLNERVAAETGLALPWADRRLLDESAPRLSHALAIEPAAVARVRPLVLDEAARQGLFVFDPQARLVASPVGPYRVEGRPQGRADDGGAAGYAAAAARQVLAAVLGPELTAAGFAPVARPGGPRALERRAGALCQRVELVATDGRHGGVQVGVAVQVSLRRADASPGLQDAWPLDPRGRPLEPTLEAPLRRFATGDVVVAGLHERGGRVEVWRERHLHELAAAWAGRLRAQALPALDACATLDGLASLLRDESPARPGAALVDALPSHRRLEAALVAGHLSGAPGLSAVRRRVELAWADGFDRPGDDGPWPHAVRVATLRQALDAVGAAPAPHAGEPPAAPAAAPARHDAPVVTAPVACATWAVALV